MKGAHLWAVGYADTDKAKQIRVEVVRLGERHSLILLDTAVAVRYADGSLTLDGQACVAALDFSKSTFASLLAGLALGAPPLTAAAADALVKGAGDLAAQVGIRDDFISEVEALMQPGSSALFVLDAEGDLEAILRSIWGLGGTVLKTNVDLERARLIQSTLSASSPAKR